MKIRNSEPGITILEALVTVAVVGVVGAAGLFAYQHNRAKVTNAAAGTSKTTTQQSKTTSTSQSTTTASPIVITGWGVQAAYSGNLTLTYTISSDGNTAYFSSNQLTALSSSCVGEGGRIIRYASTDQVSEGPADSSTPTAQQAFANADPSTYAHIGNYYYIFAHAQSGCGDISTTAAIQAQTNNAVQALIPKLQASSTTTSN